MSCQAQRGLAGSKRGKNAREQVTVVFGFNFDWLRQRGARSFSKSQSEQNNKTITFETHPKIAAKIENTFKGKMLARKWKLSFLRSIILIGLKKEARGLSANHKESKDKTITSKLI